MSRAPTIGTSPQRPAAEVRSPPLISRDKLTRLGAVSITRTSEASRSCLSHNRPPEVRAATLRVTLPMAEPASPHGTTVIECLECRRQWEVPLERWRIFLTDDDPPVPVAYCPECAAAEFD